GTGLFDFEAASRAPGWLQELRGAHKPETEEYGIGSFVYRARRPFHPQRFADWAESEWPGVVRSKGFFWLASHPTLVGEWSQAGAVARHGPTGYWWAAMSPERWPQDPEAVAAIRARWDERVGDAQQELVLIGMDMDEPALRARLDNCLLTDEEMAQGPKAWTSWHNPLPGWPPRASCG
ncbi:MAG: GTP-binding protein, partial [Lautropia sp.]